MHHRPNLGDNGPERSDYWTQPNLRRSLTVPLGDDTWDVTTPPPLVRTHGVPLELPPRRMLSSPAALGIHPTRRIHGPSMNANGFHRDTHLRRAPADGACFYHSIIQTLSDHPLFAPGELAQRVVTSLALTTLTVGELKRAIIHSQPWMELMIGLYTTWMEIDDTMRDELVAFYSSSFPEFYNYVSNLEWDHYDVDQYLHAMRTSVMKHTTFATENEVMVLNGLLRSDCGVTVHIHMNGTSAGRVSFGTRLYPSIHLLQGGIHYDTALCSARCPNGYKDCSNERINPNTEWTEFAPCIPHDEPCTTRAESCRSTDRRPYDPPFDDPDEFDWHAWMSSSESASSESSLDVDDVEDEEEYVENEVQSIGTSTTTATPVDTSSDEAYDGGTSTRRQTGRPMPASRTRQGGLGTRRSGGGACSRQHIGLTKPLPPDRFARG